MNVLKQALLSAADSDQLRRLAEGVPVTRAMVARYVAGEHTEDAVRATQALVDDGLYVTLDLLGEDTLERAQADATAAAYVSLLKALDDAALTGRAEISVKLSAVGQALPVDGHKIALENAGQLCEAAREVGTTVTLDMEDPHHDRVEHWASCASCEPTCRGTGAMLQDLPVPDRAGLPRPCARGLAGAAVRGCLRRAVDGRLLHRGGGFDKAYVRCLKVLLAGERLPDDRDARTRGS